MTEYWEMDSLIDNAPISLTAKIFKKLSTSLYNMSECVYLRNLFKNSNCNLNCCFIVRKEAAHHDQHQLLIQHHTLNKHVFDRGGF